jgi:hypothetical protein
MTDIPKNKPIVRGLGAKIGLEDGSYGMFEMTSQLCHMIFWYCPPKIDL